MALSMIGAFYVRKAGDYNKVIGFEIWAYSNVCWVISAFNGGLNIPLAFTMSFYFACNIDGIRNHFEGYQIEKKAKKILLSIPPK